MTHTHFERLNVLVVESNNHMRSIVKTMLRGFGVRNIFEADDAPEAFPIIAASKIDLVLADHVMQAQRGTDFVVQMRTSPLSPNPFIPIIMLSAYSELSNVMAARDAGMTEFCAKPLTALELYRKIYAVVNLPRSFVRADAYVGPDRRRHDPSGFSGAEKRGENVTTESEQTGQPEKQHEAEQEGKSVALSPVPEAEAA